MEVFPYWLSKPKGKHDKLITYDTLNKDSNTNKFTWRTISEEKNLLKNNTFLYVASIREKDMNEIIKFIYLMIIFISLFYTVTGK